MTQTLRLVRQVYLSNNNFEGGTTGWTSFGTPATFAQSATQKHSGQYALRIVGQTSTPRGGYFDVSINASTTYIWATWAYLVSGTYKMQADGDVAGTIINNVNVSGGTTGSWIQTFTSFTTGASDTSVRLYFLSQTNTAECYFDDMRLYELLTDFQDTGDYGVRVFSLSGLDTDFGAAHLEMDVLGSSLTDFGDNLIKLQRALNYCKQNREASGTGAVYNPVWLQWQPAASTNMLQTECFGLTADSDGAIDKVLAVPQTLLSNRLESVNLNLQIRGYFEELTPVSVSGSPFTMDTHTGTATLASIRGDLPAPLRIKVRAGNASRTQLLAALKTRQTPANFIEHFDINTAAGTGYAVTQNSATYGAIDLTDANLLNGKGSRVTPTSAIDTAAEIDWLARVIITTNPRAHTGRYRAFLRMRDNHASAPKAYLRVRSILVDSSNALLSRGSFWDSAKIAVFKGGTTTLPLLDMGVGNLPHVDMGGSLAYRVGVEIWGYTTDPSFATFDLDELFLMPCHEGGSISADGSSGFISVIFGTAMGNGANPDGVIDANDRTGAGYMVDDSDVRLQGVDSIVGNPLLAYPNQSQVLFVHTRIAGTGASGGGTTVSVNNTVVVDATPRYKLLRGS